MKYYHVECPECLEHFGITERNANIQNCLMCPFCGQVMRYDKVTGASYSRDCVKARDLQLYFDLITNLSELDRLGKKYNAPISANAGFALYNSAKDTVYVGKGNPESWKIVDLMVDEGTYIGEV